MKIVITGGCGFLGLGIARKLIERQEARKAEGLIGKQQEVESLVLFDAQVPDELPDGLDDRVSLAAGDISDRDNLESVIARSDGDTDLVYRVVKKGNQVGILEMKELVKALVPVDASEGDNRSRY